MLAATLRTTLTWESKSRKRDTELKFARETRLGANKNLEILCKEVCVCSGLTIVVFLYTEGRLPRIGFSFPEGLYTAYS